MRQAAFLFRPKEDDGPDGEDDDKRDGDQADNDADRTKDGTDGTINGGITNQIIAKNAAIIAQSTRVG